ncbi:MAG: hypothetical protein K0Q55_3547 [Verrucomicrobia bacterium]|nr:hypothetical protein [Verrucomicrobiota bacterium]
MSERGERVPHERVVTGKGSFHTRPIQAVQHERTLGDVNGVVVIYEFIAPDRREEQQRQQKQHQWGKPFDWRIRDNSHCLLRLHC